MRKKKINDEIERLDDRINSQNRIIENLRKELEGNKIIQKWTMFGSFEEHISLEDLLDTQNKLIEYLDLEWKYTEAKTELIKKDKYKWKS